MTLAFIVLIAINTLKANPNRLAFFAHYRVFARILSPTLPTQRRSKSARHARHPYINQWVTRGRINRFFCGIG